MAAARTASLCPPGPRRPNGPRHRADSGRERRPNRARKSPGRSSMEGIRFKIRPCLACCLVRCFRRAKARSGDHGGPHLRSVCCPVAEQCEASVNARRKKRTGRGASHDTGKVACKWSACGIMGRRRHRLSGGCLYPLDLRGKPVKYRCCPRNCDRGVFCPTLPLAQSDPCDRRTGKADRML